MAEGYEILARRWRPKQFSEVVGQDHVVTTLQNAIRSGRVASAYLFVGPRGTGKTSLARILAKALNCEKGSTVTPCDTCDMCRAIAQGTDLDVQEIDGASNNSVEQIRDLREAINYTPARGRYRLYIIDEVHMLSASAFNALLKTLEEPPAHVKFIFATTEPHKVLPTIVSRCQRFDLRRISVTRIVERLTRIAKAEGVEIAGDALLAIARGAEGSLRDAESALDQLIAFRGRTIEEADVLSMFGLVSRRYLEELADAIVAGDVPLLMRRVAEMEKQGKDLQRLVVELVAYFRNLLILASAGEAALPEEEIPESSRDAMRKQAALATSERMLRIVDILTETEERMRFALSRRILLEVALIRCARAVRVASLEDLLRQIQAWRSLLERPTPEPGGAKHVPASALAGPHERASASLPTAFSPMPGPPTPEETDTAKDLELLRAQWRQIVTKAGNLAVALRPMLADACPMRVTEQTVVIGIDPEFAEEEKQLHMRRNEMAVEHALREVLGRMVKVKWTVRRDEDSVTSSDHERVAEASGASPTVPSTTESDLLQDPVVQNVLKTFRGRVIEVRTVPSGSVATPGPAARQGAEGRSKKRKAGEEKP